MLTKSDQTPNRKWRPRVLICRISNSNEGTLRPKQPTTNVCLVWHSYFNYQPEAPAVYHRKAHQHALGMWNTMRRYRNMMGRYRNTLSGTQAQLRLSWTSSKRSWNLSMISSRRRIMKIHHVYRHKRDTRPRPWRCIRSSIRSLLPMTSKTPLIVETMINSSHRPNVVCRQ